MTRRKDCGYEELAVGWALHTLEPEQEAHLVRHLPSCDACAEVVRSTEQLGAALGATAVQEDPPPQLRSRLLAMVDETDQVPRPVQLPRQATEPDPVPAVAPHGGQHAPEQLRSSNVLPMRRKRQMPRLLTAAAGVVLVLVVGVLGIRVGQLSGERDQLGGQAAAAASANSRLQQAFDAVGDPNAQKIVLTGDSGQPAAILVSGRTEATVVPLKLSPNDGDHVYVVWGMSTLKPVPLATFDVPNGDAAEALHWSPEAAKHNSFAVSIEQGRTAPAAPTTVLATGIASA